MRISTVFIHLKQVAAMLLPSFLSKPNTFKMIIPRSSCTSSGLFGGQEGEIAEEVGIIFVIMFSRGALGRQRSRGHVDFLKLKQTQPTQPEPIKNKTCEIIYSTLGNIKGCPPSLLFERKDP